jgi:guanylate kinase
MTEKGILIIVSAPSGCGKSTVLHRLMEKRDKLCFSVSATTRAPREGERDGVDYFFISREQFDAMIARNEFLEHAEYVGNCYGTPKAAVDAKLAQGFDVYLDIEVQGAMQVMAQRPETLTIFLMPPSMAELERRLRLRGTDSPAVIRQRLRAAKRECAKRGAFAHVVVNDEVARAVDEISALIDAQKQKNIQNAD